MEKRLRNNHCVASVYTAGAAAISRNPLPLSSLEPQQVLEANFKLDAAVPHDHRG
jgi:hypothetical protein